MSTNQDVLKIFKAANEKAKGQAMSRLSNEYIRPISNLMKLLADQYANRKECEITDFHIGFCKAWEEVERALNQGQLEEALHEVSAVETRSHRLRDTVKQWPLEKGFPATISSEDEREAFLDVFGILLKQIELLRQGIEKQHSAR